MDDSFRREICTVGQMTDLPQIVDFVEACAGRVGVNSATRFDLQLAVEEACTNVIKHAYRSSGGEVEVCFEVQGQDVVITLRDHGRPFNPKLVVRPDLERPLEERQIGGLGLYLMEKLMDEVHFTFAEDGNTLVMVKRGIVPPAPRPDDG